MGLTPNAALPYPEMSDTPNVPRDIKALAEKLDEGGSLPSAGLIDVDAAGGTDFGTDGPPLALFGTGRPDAVGDDITAPIGSSFICTNPLGDVADVHNNGALIWRKVPCIYSHDCASVNETAWVVEKGRTQQVDLYKTTNYANGQCDGSVLWRRIDDKVELFFQSFSMNAAGASVGGRALSFVGGGGKPSCQPNTQNNGDSAPSTIANATLRIRHEDCYVDTGNVSVSANFRVVRLYPCQSPWPDQNLNTYVRTFDERVADLQRDIEIAQEETPGMVERYKAELEALRAEAGE